MDLNFAEVIKAIVIGIVEGITEWLPISSTGHMILVDEFIKLDVSKAFMDMFLVVIQLGAILSVVVTILFAQEGIVMPIIGISLGYLLIHVILEQLLLYPVLVGEAIGLTLVETIIVVLLGAVVAGVSGMILAVPAAALLKLLVPLFYQTLNARRRRKAMQAAQSSADPGT